MTSWLPRYEAKCVQRRCFQCGSVPLHSDIKGTELPVPPANILIPLERQLIALQLCRWKFLYNETLQQTFRPLLSKLSKRRQIYVLYPYLEEVRDGVEPWLMARWNARVEFLLCVIELLFTFTFAICCRPSVCLSVISLSSVCLSVCNARAPYLGGWNFQQYFYGVRYFGHPLTSIENVTEIVSGKPLRRGS